MMDQLRYIFAITILSSLLLHVNSCFLQHTPRAYDPAHLANVIRDNNQRRSLTKRHSGKIAITNVRVFDGVQLRKLGTVVIEDGRIGYNATGAKQINGNGGVLLPGLIDSHTHPASIDDLQNLTYYGITSAMTMFSPNRAFSDSIQNHTGLVDVKVPGLYATAPNSTHDFPGAVPANMTISSPNQALSFVNTQVTDGGADYIKVVAENPDSPTLSQASLNALVQAAHSYGKLAICHSAAYRAVAMTLAAGVDLIHHVPLDIALDDNLISQYVKTKRISVPTLVGLQAFVSADHGSNDGAGNTTFAAANKSATALINAHVPILAGTDSNLAKTAPAPVQFGTTLHTELELLLSAGLSTVDALRAATVLPSIHWGLPDRGVIEYGRRADLVLISGDPIANISATRSIQRVWVEGIEYAPGSNATADDAIADSSAPANGTSESSMGGTIMNGLSWGSWNVL